MIWSYSLQAASKPVKSTSVFIAMPFWRKNSEVLHLSKDMDVERKWLQGCECQCDGWRDSALEFVWGYGNGKVVWVFVWSWSGFCGTTASRKGRALRGRPTSAIDAGIEAASYDRSPTKRGHRRQEVMGSSGRRGYNDVQRWRQSVRQGSHGCGPQLEDKRARLTADVLTNFDGGKSSSKGSFSSCRWKVNSLDTVVSISDDIDITLARKNLKSKFKKVRSKLQLGKTSNFRKALHRGEVGRRTRRCCIAGVPGEV